MDSAKHDDKKTIAILGAGAVGGFLSAIFCKAGENVYCIDKPENVEKIKRDGITLNSAKYGTFVARPIASERLAIKPDLLFIATKSPGLSAALARIDPELVSESIIIPLLNGFKHMAIIRPELGRRVAAGSISIGVLRQEPGVVDHVTSFVGIELASDSDISRDRLEKVVEWLDTLGIKGQVGKSEAEVLWKKLVRLNVLACCTTATDRPIGELRVDPIWRERMQKCAAEGSEVAKTQGVDIDPVEAMKQIDALDPMQMSSMQRDVSAGKESELDAIPGAILRLAEKENIPCPHISEIHAMISQKIEERTAELKKYLV